MNGCNMDGTDAPKVPDTNRKPSFRRPSRRCIYIIVAVTILCIVICIVLAVQLRPKSENDCPKGVHCDWRSMPHSEFLKDERCESLCTTRPCIRSAQYVLSRIDSSKDPCEDFYEFACGTYEEQALIFPEQNEGVYTFQEMENEVLLNLKEIIDSIDENPDKGSLALRLTKNLYNDCMETDSNPDVLTKEIWKRLFAENGGFSWPLVNKNTRSDPKHLLRMMVSTLFFGGNPFFRIRDVGITNINKKDFFVLRLEYPENIYHLQSIHDDQNSDDDESLINRYLFALGQILTEVGVDAGELKEIVPRIKEVERHFINLTMKALEDIQKVYENNRHLSYEFRNHSCQDLDHNMRNIKWCDLVKELREEYQIPSDIPVRIILPSLGNYFAAVDTVLGHYLDRDIINYIAVKFMFHNMKYMPSPLREIYYRERGLFRTDRISLPLTARWQQCVEVVNDFMGVPLEKEYLGQKLDQKSRDQVRDLANKIKNSYLSLLDKMSWMKRFLKGLDLKMVVRDLKLVIARANELLSADEEAIDKLFSLGFDDRAKLMKDPLFLDVLHMTEYYNKVGIVPDFDGYTHMLRSSRFFETDTISRINVDEIDLSYEHLVFPMFLPGRPMYTEYANLGFYITSYITSVLSVNMKPENSTIQAFLDGANCLAEQSHLYKAGDVMHKISMTELDKEDAADEISRLIILIGDTLSTHVTFQAYADYLKQNGDDKGLPGLPFTNEQLYFISAAQAQCEKIPENANPNPKRPYSGRFRVNVPFSHLKEFSEAFRCPVDSSMNLKRRCCLLGDGKLARDCK